MTRNLGKLILISILVTGVAACKGKNSTGPAPAPPPVGGAPPAPPATPPTVAQKFGAAFATIFAAAATAEPKDPAAGDLGPVTATGEPVDF
jgi:hypothetical protein